MVFERLLRPKMQSLEKLRWYGIWIPSTVVSVFLIAEGLLESYFDIHWSHDLALHILMIGLLTGGAYYFYTFIFNLVRQNQEEVLRHTQAEAALERRFRALIENSSDGIALFDLEGTFLYASPATTRILGYPPDEVLGWKVLDLVHPEEREDFKTRFAALKDKSSGIMTASCRVQHRDSSWRWIGIVANNLTAEPSVQGIVCNYRDITERMQAEEALRNANQRLTTVLGSISDIYFALDRDWRLVEVNPIAEEQVFRCAATELLGKVLWEKFPDIVPTEFYRQYQTAATRGQPVHFEAYCPLTRGWFEEHVYPREGRLEIYGRDITQRKKAEEERERLLARVEQEREHAEALSQTLQKERDLLDVIMDNTGAHLAYLDPGLNFVRVNSTYAQGSGHPREELVGRNHFALFPDAENQAIFERARDSGQPVQFRAKPFEFADQPWRRVTYWDWTLTPLKDHTGRVQGLVLSLFDVTESIRASQERERLLEENRRQREFLEQLMNAAPVGIAVVSGPDHRYEFANPCYQAIPGMPAVLMQGRTIADIFPAVVAKGALRFLETAYRSGETVSIREYEASVGPGRERTYWNVDHVPLRGAKGDVERILILASEVTDQVLSRMQVEEMASRDKAILTSMTEGLIVFDMEGHILEMNPAALRIHGFQYVEEAQSHFQDYAGTFEVSFLDGRPLPVEQCPFARVLRGETFSGDEVRVRRPDEGDTQILSYSGTLARNKEGEPVLGILTVRDVTVQKQAEEALVERARLATLSAEVGLAFMATDDLKVNLRRCVEAMVECLNAAFARIWTFNEEENVLELQASAGIYTHLDGPHSRKFLGEGKIGVIAKERRAHLTNAVVGDPGILDQEWAKREGIVAFAGLPLLVEGRLVGAMGVFGRSPMTEGAFQTMGALASSIALNIERKRTKKALRKANEELELRVQERTAELLKISEALRQSQARLSAIISSAMDAIITINSERRIILFNSAAEKIYRCRADAALGQPIEHFMPERFRQAHPQHIHSFARTGMAGRWGGAIGTVTGLRADGEEFPAEIAISHMQVADQDLYTAIVRDITERKQAEEALRKLSSAVEQTADAVCITDRNGTIEYVNPAFERLNGYTLEEAHGQTPRILKSGLHDQESYERLWATILSGEVFQGEVLNKKKDGTLYYSALTITPIRDSQAPSRISSARVAITRSGDRRRKSCGAPASSFAP